MSHSSPVPAPSASKPVLIVFSLLAAMNVVNGGLAALDVLPVKVVGIIALATAGVTAGVMFYVQGVVVPLEAVGARLTNDGKMVTGPADQTIPAGTEVQLTPTAPGAYNPQQNPPGL